MGFFDQLTKNYDYVADDSLSVSEETSASLYEQLVKKHNYQRHHSHSKYDIAVYAPARRTARFIPFADHLAATNACNFKLFLCGDIVPDVPLPENIVFLYAPPDMSPGACVEIAQRAALAENAEYIMSCSDDVELPVGMLDDLINEVKTCEVECVAAPIFCFGGVAKRACRHEVGASHIISYDLSSPIVPICPVMKTSTLKKLCSPIGGAVDKRFQGVYWDLDISLRLQEMGIRIKILPEVVVHEIGSLNVKGGPGLFGRCMQHDMPLLYQLWAPGHRGAPDMKKGMWRWLPLKRVEPVQYYSDEDLSFTIHPSTLPCLCLNR